MNRASLVNLFAASQLATGCFEHAVLCAECEESIGCPLSLRCFDRRCVSETFFCDGPDPACIDAAKLHAKTATALDLHEWESPAAGHLTTTDPSWAPCPGERPGGFVYAGTHGRVLMANIGGRPDLIPLVRWSGPDGEALLATEDSPPPAGSRRLIRNEGLIFAPNTSLADRLIPLLRPPATLLGYLLPPQGPIPCTPEFGALSGGWQYTTAIRRDGALYTFGQNEAGQLGISDLTDRLEPTRVGGDFDWSEVSLATHSLGVRRDGSLWVWGRNVSGRLGTGPDPILVAAPRRIAEDRRWAHASAGLNFSLAIDTSGSLWVWGENTGGQLGLGDVENRSVPTVLEGHEWIAASGGTAYTLGLDDAGIVWAWGDNERSRTGLGMARSTVPRRVPDLPPATRIAAGGGQSAAIDRDGVLWVWGDNLYGQRGDGTTGPGSDRPRAIAGRSAWVEISSGDTFFAGLQMDGSLWVWGAHGEGELGVGPPLGRVMVPQEIPPPAGADRWIAVDASWRHIVALDGAGRIWASGRGQHGALGQGHDADLAALGQVLSTCP
jgi:alpha-tubulin suppressor-like RCC1 family protein